MVDPEESQGIPWNLFSWIICKHSISCSFLLLDSQESLYQSEYQFIRITWSTDSASQGVSNEVGDTLRVTCQLL